MFVKIKGLIKNKLLSLKDLIFSNFSFRSFSQEGEDMILRRIFEGVSCGFYVDVGAHHPKRFSNTYYFYKKGWRGLNIDAMPGSMKLFKILRPRDINLEIPISSIRKKLNYYIFNETALNGFSKELSIKRSELENYHIIDKVPMETSTLNEVLLANIEPGKEIDFMSIDVEGLDYDVLISNDFSLYKPKVILIEVLGNKMSDLNNDKIVKYLETRGYFIISRTFNTVFFVREEFYKTLI